MGLESMHLRLVLAHCQAPLPTWPSTLRPQFYFKEKTLFMPTDRDTALFT